MRTSTRALLVVVLVMFAVAAVIGAAAEPPAAKPEDPHFTLARRVLAKVPLIDGHNDLPWELRELAGNRDERALRFRIA